MVVMVAVEMVPVGRMVAAHHWTTEKITIPIGTRMERPIPKSTAAATTRTLSPTHSRTQKRAKSARYGILPLVQSIVDMAVDMREEIRLPARAA